ncbi:hypothetical protein PInf_017084 [Phytophthora infestans]|nr:hypothetical protein PInf_017084 [Phytophthora infestans]
MALVNAFIIFREAQKMVGEGADHAGFLAELQAQLLPVTSADFIDEHLPTKKVASISAAHKLTEFPEWTQIQEGVRKRPQHQCKVCSIRKQKVGQRIRPGHYPGNTMTCHQIWHVMWKNGEERPHPRVGRGIQMRSPAKKRRRAASDTEEGSGAEEGGAGSGTVEGGAGSDTDVGAEERSGGEGCAGEDDSE